MSQLDSLRGVVIMFDGPDGVGKSTQLELAAKSLAEQGLQVEQLHVLGGTPIGNALREVLFSKLERPAETDTHTILAIHYALAAKLRSLAAEGKVVLIDRSPLSFIAYQVYGSKFNETKGYAVCDEAMSLDKPDLIIIYKAPKDVLLERRQKQLKDRDYFEKQSQEFHDATVAGYDAAAEHYGLDTLDASGSLAEVHTHTMEAIKALAAQRQ